MRAVRGFSLLEVLIVLVLIAIITTIALPSLLGSKLASNETAAITTLRQAIQSQVQFVSRGEADVNGNGTGEYGTFGEMSGNVPVRAANGGTKFLAPEVINRSFRFISNLGELFRNGYHFRFYLPDIASNGLIELPMGGADPNIDPHQAENLWCLYAWPQSYGVTGRRSFFVNQEGTILFTEDPAYEGRGAPLTAGAALAPGGPPTSMTGAIAHGTAGRDGNTWKPLGP